MFAASGKMSKLRSHLACLVDANTGQSISPLTTYIVYKLSINIRYIMYADRGEPSYKLINLTWLRMSELTIAYLNQCTLISLTADETKLKAAQEVSENLEVSAGSSRSVPINAHLFELPNLSCTVYI